MTKKKNIWLSIFPNLNLRPCILSLHPSPLNLPSCPLNLLTCIFLLFTCIFPLCASDTLNFKGQLSLYSHYNPDNTLQWWNGARYIPQLNYEYRLPSNQLIDFEASANLYGNIGLNLSDSNTIDGDIKPYRLWGRYSSEQFEFRVGLQKINFGSATILRPLMWFDQIDARDPLKLTDGVWGALARYYFLNNANIWAWALYGNKNLKGLEMLTSQKKIPEFGGRFQFPVLSGETAVTYHHRAASGSNLPDTNFHTMQIPENRFGFDAKFDMIVGCWIEASWSNFAKDLGMYTNQEYINLGVDYTFGIGNGLTVIGEQLIASFDTNPFGFENTTTFSLLSLSYPVGLFDNLSAICYYDWTNNQLYNFVNWQRQFNWLALYLMAYYNPENYNLPAQGVGEVLYAGYGFQAMLVFNH